MKRASNDTLAGRRYLDLQREAKRTGRPTDEIIQLYALECFLDRLAHSKFADSRTLTLKDGATVIEKLKRWNDAGHSYTYRIVASPLPVANYESTIQVTSNKVGTGSVITWRGRYVAKGANDVDAKKIIDGIYESGLAALAGD